MNINTSNPLNQATLRESAILDAGLISAIKSVVAAGATATVNDGAVDSSVFFFSSFCAMPPCGKLRKKWVKCEPILANCNKLPIHKPCSQINQL